VQGGAVATDSTLQTGAAAEALQLYAQAALLDAGDVVLWNRMGVLVRASGRDSLNTKSFGHYQLHQGFHRWFSVPSSFDGCRALCCCRPHS
jgi:hypothetical protein